ncbi:transcriptional regulator [Oenococcus alcoholitolerans]|uniref:Transcriptional regulator n=1 Tax=Oenococcus alcoholitolerans TaxID=931074 RepID=A0ABR4XQN7_9LACO|nr:transcriptional regulator [Oenococcus alcoholitolerans]
MNKNKKQLKKNKKRHLSVFLAVIGIIFIIAYPCYYFLNVQGFINKSYFSTGLTSEKNANKIIENKKPISILILGTDIGTGEGFGANRNRVGLTDSLMLAIINPKKKTTTLISVPRDIMTSIVGFENSFPQKLNAAYAFKEASDNKTSLGEGVGTTMQTIEKMFNIPIDYFAMVNMSGLGDVVNQIGGVSVKSPLTFLFSQDTAHDYGKNLYRFNQGSTTFQYAADGINFKTYQKMNGVAALAFSRMRYQDPKGDYGRTERQRLLLEQIVKKVKQKPSLVFNLKFINSSTKNVATDLKTDNLISLANNYISATKNIKSYTVQGEPEIYNGVSYQRVTTAQRQAVTNEVRKDLNLKKEKTGSEFGSGISQTELYQVGTADFLYPDDDTENNSKLN